MRITPLRNLFVLLTGTNLSFFRPVSAVLAPNSQQHRMMASARAMKPEDLNGTLGETGFDVGGSNERHRKGGSGFIRRPCLSASRDANENLNPPPQQVIPKPYPNSFPSSRTQSFKHPWNNTASRPQPGSSATTIAVPRRSIRHRIPSPASSRASFSSIVKLRGTT